VLLSPCVLLKIPYNILLQNHLKNNVNDHPKIPLKPRKIQQNTQNFHSPPTTTAQPKSPHRPKEKSEAQASLFVIQNT